MLREVKGLHRLTIQALDGEIGKVVEILFDDAHWTVRYLVVETGSWLFGRKVLISPLAFKDVKWEEYQLHCSLTCKQIKNSPSVDTDEPVSRQWESDYYGYHGWPTYWGSMGRWGAYSYPGALLSQPFGSAVTQQTAADPAREHNDAHLRSTKEVTGYKISATDGHLGHIEDFIIDDETWRINYLAVDTRNWWPGKKVLLPPDWIGSVNWSDRSVTVNVTRDQVRNAPEWGAGQPISRAFEAQLYGYYDRQRPLDHEQG